MRGRAGAFCWGLSGERAGFLLGPLCLAVVGSTLFVRVAFVSLLGPLVEVELNGSGTGKAVEGK